MKGSNANRQDDARSQTAIVGPKANKAKASRAMRGRIETVHRRCDVLNMVRMESSLAVTRGEGRNTIGGTVILGSSRKALVLKVDRKDKK